MEEGTKKSSFEKKDFLMERNIFFTIAYFNALGLAPSTFEIWFHYFDFWKTGQKVSFEKVEQFLEKEETLKKISHFNGFWFFKGYKKIAQKRIKKQKISVTKIKKACKIALFFGLVPYLRGVFVTGTLALKNAEKKSDWDVLIIVEKERIWLGRLFISLFLEILGKRRKREKIKDCFCLNHFLTLDNLEFEEKNEFAANEISFSFPIFGKEIFQQFIFANNNWIKTEKPNFCKKRLISPFFISSFSEKLSLVGRFWENVFEFLKMGKLINKILKNLMIKRILNNPKTYTKGADIRFGDSCLVFLPQPHRKKIRQKALQIMKEKEII